MAIVWYKEGKENETTHEGLVLGGHYSTEVRIMSDVYATRFYVMVWNLEKGHAETVDLGTNFENDLKHGRATMDAPPAIIAEWRRQCAEFEARREETKRKRQAEDARKRAEAAAKEPRKGRLVKVVRGRTNPKGTTGVVFWLSDGRIGIATSERRDASGKNLDVAWDYTRNVEALPADEGNSPDEVEARIAGARQAYRDARARKQAAEKQTVAAIDTTPPF